MALYRGPPGGNEKRLPTRRLQGRVVARDRQQAVLDHVGQPERPEQVAEHRLDGCAVDLDRDRRSSRNLGFLEADRVDVEGDGLRLRSPARRLDGAEDLVE